MPNFNFVCNFEGRMTLDTIYENAQIMADENKITSIPEEEAKPPPPPRNHSIYANMDLMERGMMEMSETSEKNDPEDDSRGISTDDQKSEFFEGWLSCRVAQNDCDKLRTTIEEAFRGKEDEKFKEATELTRKIGGRLNRKRESFEGRLSCQVAQNDCDKLRTTIEEAFRGEDEKFKEAIELAGKIGKQLKNPMWEREWKKAKEEKSCRYICDRVSFYFCGCMLGLIGLAITGFVAIVFIFFT